MELLVEVQVPGETPWVCRAEQRSPRRLRIRSGSFELGLPGEPVVFTVLDDDQTTFEAEILWAANGSAELLLAIEQAASAIRKAG